MVKIKFIDYLHDCINSQYIESVIDRLADSNVNIEDCYLFDCDHKYHTFFLFDFEAFYLLRLDYKNEILKGTTLHTYPLGIIYIIFGFLRKEFMMNKKNTCTLFFSDDAENKKLAISLIKDKNLVKSIESYILSDTKGD